MLRMVTDLKTSTSVQVWKSENVVAIDRPVVVVDPSFPTMRSILIGTSGVSLGVELLHELLAPIVQGRESFVRLSGSVLEVLYFVDPEVRFPLVDGVST